MHRLSWPTEQQEKCFQLERRWLFWLTSYYDVENQRRIEANYSSKKNDDNNKHSGNAIKKNQGNNSSVLNNGLFRGITQLPKPWSFILTVSISLLWIVVILKVILELLNYVVENYRTVTWQRPKPYLTRPF